MMQKSYILAVLSLLLVSPRGAIAQDPTPPDAAPPDAVSPMPPGEPAEPSFIAPAPADPNADLDWQIDNRLRNSPVVRDAINDAVDRNFAWTFGLLNILLLLLILFPIAGIALLWWMRREMVSQVVDEVENHLSDELKAEVSRELKADFAAAAPASSATPTAEPAQLKDMVSMALSVQNVMSNARHTIENSMQLQDRLNGRLQDVLELQMMQGRQLEANGQYTEAIAAFDRAIEVDERHPEAYCAKGTLLVTLQRLEEALATYAEAVKVAPDCAEAWYGIARCYALVGHQEPAIENLKKAIHLNPSLKEKAQESEAFASLREQDAFQTALAVS
ncbi:MAG: tetratricopeptide repeat protein [Phormidium sp. GEM2.Bin31]|nr:tetratricopeptide repeat protein [Phormidium sp. BM_Day4_Bin.17]TVR06580.1 MAG: tetratricopeptide repeat protein [Phormidium sp. GEM2.Bin31]UCJ13988.1 MAG: tetratricopeptide repeat protein [Phormidium sp. PBR-2020]